SGTKGTSYQANHRFVDQITFTPDGQSLIFRCEDPRPRVWQFRDSLDSCLKLAGHSKEAWALAFSPDGTLLASGADDNLIKIWDVKTGSELLTLTGHDQTVTSVGFLPDGNRLASVSLDHSLRLWTLARDALDGGRLSARSVVLARYDHDLRTLAIAPDGQ